MPDRLFVGSRVPRFCRIVPPQMKSSDVTQGREVCRNGLKMDETARQAEFVRLFSANQRRIQTFIFTLLPDRDQAQDVMQETSVVLWQKFDSFETGTDFTAWAFRIARLEVLSLVRRQQRARLVFDEAICRAVGRRIHRKRCRFRKPIEIVASVRRSALRDRPRSFATAI